MLFIIVMVYVFLFSYLEAMESSSDVRTITLTVDPLYSYSMLGFKKRSDAHDNIAAYLSGFCCDNNKVHLLLKDDTYYTTEECVLSGQSYTEESLLCALQKKKINQYPLSWHKKIEMLEGNERLELVKLTEHGKEVIKFPEAQKKELLFYLLHDATQSKRNSFDMCKAIGLEKETNQSHRNFYKPLIHYVDFIDSTVHCSPGIVLGFYTHECKNFNHTIKLRQYAIALCDDLCLSKLSKGFLFVSTIKSLQKFYQCEGYAQINPAIGNRKDFLNNRKQLIQYIPISMYIYPHNKIVCRPQSSSQAIVTGLEAFLGGFFPNEYQISLRSDIVLVDKDGDNPYLPADEIAQLLLSGEAQSYPFYMHKKLCRIVGNEVLRIFFVDENNHAKKINMPHIISKKLFYYLQNDSADKRRQCFNFCQALCLKHYDKEQLLDESISYQSDIEDISEDEIKPGDVLALSEAEENKHYAIALGNKLYISKFGNGGPLIVTDMQSMMDAFYCTKFVRIKPTITRYESFWKVVLPS